MRLISEQLSANTSACDLAATSDSRNQSSRYQRHARAGPHSAKRLERNMTDNSAIAQTLTINFIVDSEISPGI
jgi:hypothetical protein